MDEWMHGWMDGWDGNEKPVEPSLGQLIYLFRFYVEN